MAPAGIALVEAFFEPRTFVMDASVCGPVSIKIMFEFGGRGFYFVHCNDGIDQRTENSYEEGSICQTVPIPMTKSTIKGCVQMHASLHCRL